jgi:hypothetical protein
MFSRLLLVAGLMGVWSCSDDEKPGANLGGAGADSAGSAGRSQAGASGAADAGQAGASAAGHSGSSAGGAMMGGAGEAASGSGNLGGGGNHAGAGGAGLGGAAAGAGGGGAGSDENPYRACANEDDDSCPVPGSMCHADYGCQPPCPTGTVSCPAALGGGTATPYCQQKLCRLDCGFGKTCPTGMTCDTATSFCTPNGQ